MVKRTLMLLSHRLIVISQKMLLVIGLSCLFLNLNAQDWEVVKVYDFSDPAFQSNLSGVSTFVASGFNLNDFGATGTFGDKCAFNSTYGPNEFIAMQETLEQGVNYRIKVNAKAANGTSQLSFRMGSSPGTFAIDDIQLNVPITQAGLMNPGQDITSTSFTVDSDGTYWLTAIHAFGFGNWVVLDNFTLEKEAIVASTPSFSLTQQGSSDLIDNLSLLPGESVTVCLTPDEILEDETTVDISVNGNNLPHFENFSESLTFLGGSQSSLCFELQAEEENTETSYNFDIAISNETIQTFTVLVFDCDQFGGPDAEICEGEEVQLGTNCLPTPHPIDEVEYCYFWTPSTGLDDPSSVMPTATPIETTTYTVIVTDNSGSKIAWDQVTVNVLPSPEFTLSITESVICENQSIVIVAEPEMDYTYNWSTGEDGSAIQVTEAGTYNVTATDDQNCTNSSSSEILDIGADNSGINQYFSSNGFYCFPSNIQVTVMGDEQLNGDSGATNRNPIDPCNDNSCTPTAPGVCIEDHANYAIRINNELIPNLEAAIHENLSFFASEFGYENVKGFITRNEDVCLCPGGYLNEVAKDYNTAEVAFWIHVSDDPNSEDDKLYIASKMPTIPGQNFPFDAEHIDVSLSTIVTDLSTAEFPTNASQALYATMFELLDNKLPDTKIDLGDFNPCGNIVQTQKFMAPSGALVQPPAGSIPRFFPDKYFTGKLPVGCLVGFVTDEFVRYKGILRNYTDPSVTDLFLGYYSNDSKVQHSFPALEEGSHHEVLLGVLTVSNYLDYPDLLDCKKIMLRKVIMGSPTGIWNQLGSGELMDNSLFDDWVLLNVNEDYRTFAGQYYINCPQISFNQFQLPTTVEVYNHPDLGPSWYFSFCESDENGQNTICKYVWSYIGETGDTEYQYFDCAQGIWIDFDPPNRPAYDVLGDLIFAAWETVIAPTLTVTKITLDVLAFAGFPPAGLAALVIDAGLAFYSIANGDVVEGVVSILFSGAGLYAFFKGGKWVLSQNSDGLTDFLKNLMLRKPNGDYVPVLENQLESIMQFANDAGLTQSAVTAFANAIFSDQNGIPFLEELLSDNNTSVQNVALIKAWQFFHGVGSSLQYSVSALKILSDPDMLARFESNTQLVNFLENLNNAGKISLLENMEDWAELYDVRANLLNGEWTTAIAFFNGNLVPTHITPEGYSFVFTGSPNSVYIDKTVQTIETDDVSIVAQNFANALGLPNELDRLTDILSFSKEQMFEKDHLIEVAENDFMVGKFEPLPGQGIDHWISARNNFVGEGGANGALPNDITGFTEIIAQAYIEGKLMEKGVHVKSRNWNPDSSNTMTSYNYGAKDLSPQMNNDFSHWTTILQRYNAPPAVLSDLSNLDDIVDFILTKEGIE